MSLEIGKEKLLCDKCIVFILPSNKLSLQLLNPFYLLIKFVNSYKFTSLGGHRYQLSIIIITRNCVPDNNNNIIYVY